MFKSLQLLPQATTLFFHPPEMREDLKNFFGPRAETYLKLFDRENKGGHAWAGWNTSWPALFGGFVWFFYRRLYLYGAVALLTPLVILVLFGNAGLGGAWAIMASMAKPLYYNVALARVRKADALGLTGAERVDYLRRAGGVSPVSGVLGGLMFVSFLGLTILRVVRPDLLR